MHAFSMSGERSTSEREEEEAESEAGICVAVGQVTEGDSDHRPCEDDGDEWVASLNASLFSLAFLLCVEASHAETVSPVCVLWIVMRIEAHKQ